MRKKKAGAFGRKAIETHKVTTAEVPEKLTIRHKLEHRIANGFALDDCSSRQRRTERRKRIKRGQRVVGGKTAAGASAREVKHSSAFWRARAFRSPGRFRCPCFSINGQA